MAQDVTRILCVHVYVFAPLYTILLRLIIPLLLSLLLLPKKAKRVRGAFCDLSVYVIYGLPVFLLTTDIAINLKRQSSTILVF